MSPTDPSEEKMVIRYEDLPESDEELTGTLPPAPTFDGPPLSITEAQLRPARAWSGPVAVSALAVGIVSIALVAVLAIWIARTSPRAEANERYWNELCAIDVRISASSPNRGGDGTELSKADISSIARVFHASARRIAALDIADVDTELVKLGRQRAMIVEDSAILYDRIAEYLARNETAEPERKSGRTLLGDRHHELLDQARALEARGTEYLAEAQELRAALMRRYPGDFHSPAAVSDKTDVDQGNEAPRNR
jgi:hypothetical protein